MVYINICCRATKMSFFKEKYKFSFFGLVYRNDFNYTCIQFDA